jgi:predicted ArsR family transcriptional regulator
MLHHAREIAPSVAWDILLRIKRSGGLSVNELCAQLKMSYMGVKQHCDALKKRGYLDTWRRPKPTGRPEKLYRAAEKLDLVLPQWGNELSLGLLKVVAQLNGETAAERLLHHYFLQKTERLLLKIKGATLRQRAAELAKMRGADGCICQVEHDSATELRLVEHHNPLAEVARLYPDVCEMETRMISKLLGVPVRRTAGEWSVEFHAAEEAEEKPFRLVAE